MGLFSKKKKPGDPLSPLTERDIQKKLYGDLKPLRGEEERFDNHRQLNPPPPPVSSAPSHDAGFVTSVTTEERPVHPKKSHDLFDLPPSQQPPKHTEAKQRKSTPEETTEKQNEAERLRRLSEIAKTHSSNQPSKAVPSWQKSAGTRSQQPTSADFAGKTGSDKLLSFIALLVKGVFGVLFLLFGIVFKVFSLVDFRRPEVRRVIYWLGGAVVLISIFLGIHILNVRREAAMQAPPAAQKSTAAQEEKKKTETQEETPKPETRDLKKEEKKEERAEPKPAAPTADQDAINNPYAIQIATYAGPSDAERVAENLKEAGVQAFSKALGRPSGRIYYSVFIGRFPDYRTAQLKFEEFRKKEVAAPFQDAFIRTLD